MVVKGHMVVPHECAVNDHGCEIKREAACVARVDNKATVNSVVINVEAHVPACSFRATMAVLY